MQRRGDKFVKLSSSQASEDAPSLARLLRLSYEKTTPCYSLEAKCLTIKQVYPLRESINVSLVIVTWSVRQMSYLTER